MKIFIGLGNPCPEYSRTRHNIGFRVIDALADKYGIKIGRNKFHALVGEAVVEGEKSLLVKPQTYMNLSGLAAAGLVRYHPVRKEDLLVIFDDMDLPLGQIRLRPHGGSGGHKGMASIIESLGTDKIPRLRIGIGKSPEFLEGADFVLSAFTADDEKVLPEVIDRACQAVDSFVREGLDRAMNVFNR